MEIEPLPRSEYCHRRTRNSNSENNVLVYENQKEIMMMKKTTPRKNSKPSVCSSIMTINNSKKRNSSCFSINGSKHKVKSGKSMAGPLLSFKTFFTSAYPTASTCVVSSSPSSIFASRTFIRCRRSWCSPIVVLNALIFFLLFTNAINFGDCAVNSAPNSGDSLINQPQHTIFDDTTTTTSSTKFNNNNNNNNYNNNNNNKNSNKLNDTQNLLLPQLANQQKR